VQEILDDPATPGRRFAHPRLPDMPLDQAISRFYASDVFMHTWDLARATGQDERLDEDRCRELYEGMLPLDDLLRQSGQYGPKVPVPDDADWQTLLLPAPVSGPHALDLSSTVPSWMRKAWALVALPFAGARQYDESFARQMTAPLPPCRLATNRATRTMSLTAS
jgi:hypothetical protein